MLSNQYKSSIFIYFVSICHKNYSYSQYSLTKNMLAMENYKILLFLSLLASSTFASAQTAPYYYSGGEKIC